MKQSCFFMLAVIKLGLGRKGITFNQFSSMLHKFATYFKHENSFAAGKVNYVFVSVIHL